MVWGGREECLGYLWGEGRGVPHCLRLSQWDWGAQMLKRSFWGVEKVFVALGGSSPAAGGGGGGGVSEDKVGPVGQPYGG